MPKPLPLRKLRAEMELKELSLTTVAKRARLNLSVACDLLNGKRVDEARLAKLRKVITEAHVPGEVAA
jgi:hypothetical protein